MTGSRLIVLGRQGAGKGTQCARLAAHLGVPHISTGDLLRGAIAANLGTTESRRSGYLLDGFPRTIAQGTALFEVLGAGAAEVAVEIDVPVAEVLLRLVARRVCEGCGAVTAAPAGWTHHLACPACGGIARRRDDDTDEAIARRLALYDEQSTSLLVWLADRGILITVDGTGSPDEVFRRLLSVVEPRLAHLGERSVR